MTPQEALVEQNRVEGKRTPLANEGLIQQSLLPDKVEGNTLFLQAVNSIFSQGDSQGIEQALQFAPLFTQKAQRLNRGNLLKAFIDVPQEKKLDFLEQAVVSGRLKAAEASVLFQAETKKEKKNQLRLQEDFLRNPNQETINDMVVGGVPIGNILSLAQATGTILGVPLSERLEGLPEDKKKEKLLDLAAEGRIPGTVLDIELKNLDKSKFELESILNSPNPQAALVKAIDQGLEPTKARFYQSLINQTKQQKEEFTVEFVKDPSAKTFQEMLRAGVKIPEAIKLAELVGFSPKTTSFFRQLNELPNSEDQERFINAGVGTGIISASQGEGLLEAIKPDLPVAENTKEFVSKIQKAILEAENEDDLTAIAAAIVDSGLAEPDPGGRIDPFTKKNIGIVGMGASPQDFLITIVSRTIPGFGILSDRLFKLKNGSKKKKIEAAGEFIKDPDVKRLLKIPGLRTIFEAVLNETGTATNVEDLHALKAIQERDPQRILNFLFQTGAKLNNIVPSSDNIAPNPSQILNPFFQSGANLDNIIIQPPDSNQLRSLP